MPTTTIERHRLGIVLAGLSEANVDALRFLVLQMNRLQSAFEFEFLPDFDNSFLDQLKAFDSTAALSPLDRKKLRTEVPAFVEKYLAFLSGQNEEWTLAEEPPNYFLIISLARLSEGYYSLREGAVSLIALGDWKTEMAPPSILEFILTLVLREALASVSPALRGSQHLGTKGCLCDFTANLDEVRIKVLSSYLCAHCSNALIANGQARLVKEVRRVLAKRWLGKVEDAGSPASIAAMLGYNLFVTKGLKPTWLERASATLQEEGVKELVKWAIPTIGGGLLLWLGFKKAG